MKFAGRQLPFFLTFRPSFRILSVIVLLPFIFWVLNSLSRNNQLYILDLQNLIQLPQNQSSWFAFDDKLGGEKIEPEMPSVDKSPKMNETELVNELEPQMPNLPVLYWQENKHKQMKKNESCARYPDIYDLRFNKYWQVMESSNGTYNLYAAYLDVRELNPRGPTVRILSMIDRLEPWYQDTHCQLWFSEATEPVFSKVVDVHLVWQTWWANYAHGLFQPFLLACPLPETHKDKVPTSVSLVEQPCNYATNNLKVIYDKPEPAEKKKFAVCVKFLHGPHMDNSVRMAEWIELLHALGADKIFLYDLGVHPNVTKVLDHYVSKGVVDVTAYSLPGYQPNLPLLDNMYLVNRDYFNRQNEIIPLNDCFYRNMYKYDYFALQDIDEVIMPLKHNGWADMMKEVINASLSENAEMRSSWVFRNVYFLDNMLDMQGHGNFSDIPPYMHMMQHVYRSYNYTNPGDYIKCFHNAERVLLLHNHYPLGCLPYGACFAYDVDLSVGHLQHYRTECTPDLVPICHKYREIIVKDTAIWKWKEKVIQGTSESLRQLGFFDSNKNSMFMN